MPLSKKRDRARKKKSNPTRLETDSLVFPSPKSNPTRLETARAALDALQSTRSPLKDDSNNLPRYNPSKHKAGDKVLIFRDGRWLPYLVPNMDGSGQEIPEWY